MKTANNFAPFAFDAVIALALALNRSRDLLSKDGLSLDEFRYNNTVISNTLIKTMKEITFQGVTGDVAFDTKNDRIMKTAVYQSQGGSLKFVASFAPGGNEFIFINNRSFIWQDGKIPQDSTIQTRVFIYVKEAVFVIMATLSTIGVVVAAAFLVFNIVFRKDKYIKMSSPKMNNAIVSGCILLYFSGILLGIDSRLTTPYMVSILCKLNVFFPSIGFSVAFGAMFFKMWRVYVIFNGKIKRKVIKDLKLFGIVAALMAVDLIIFVLWQLTDPITRRVQPAGVESTKTEEEELVYFIEQCSCEYENLWKCTVFVYKGALLMFGTILAWETRDVCIRGLNDSKYVGLSVYSVVATCVMGIPLNEYLRTQVNISYVILGFMTTFCTTVSLCLVFVPKVLHIKQTRTRVIAKNNPLKTAESGRQVFLVQENSVSHVVKTN